jgi:hypothetical protein
MNARPLGSLLLCFLPIACDCEADLDRREEHLKELLQANIASGVLVGSAVPCGPDGVASRPESFVRGAPQAEVDRLAIEFDRLCGEYLKASEDCPD